MPEHYTKATVSATFWCAKCGKPTLHRVDAGRRGPCLDCLERPRAEKRPHPARQMGLFGERKEAGDGPGKD